jgi:predicted ATPase
MADAAGSRHGLPVALTSFGGRAPVVEEVAGLLGQDRLVTVPGSGGAGKTRVAGEVAARVADRFTDGAWLAELAMVQDPAPGPAAVAAVLGIRDLPSVAASEMLARALARRQLWLVLDNCEHVIGAAQAATIILDGVRSGAWRILVGQDAAMIDERIRANPEAAYDYAELFRGLAPS